MVTKTIIPVSESTSNNVGADYSGYDFGQVNLDIIQFEASMFETYMKHDFASLQALDESSLQIINEMTIKEAVDKLVQFVSSIWDKISQAFSRAITTLSAKFDTYGKFAKKMEEKVNSELWIDSKEKVKSISITFYDKINDFAIIPSVNAADKYIHAIMDYINTGDENKLMVFGDKNEYFKLSGSKNSKELNSNTFKDLTSQGATGQESFNLVCNKQNAMSIINGLKNAKHTITSLTQTKKTTERAFKKLKSEVSTLKKLEKDIGKNKDENILKVIATAQKAISTYSSVMNIEINASISALGKIYSSGMKTLKDMISIAYKSSGNKRSDKTIDKNKHMSGMKKKFEEDEIESKNESADVESSWSGTDNAGDTWNDDQDEDNERLEESTFDVFGMILEGEFGDNGEFIEPDEPDVDETKPQYDSEKDNYENDPEDDDAIPDLMDDSDSVETVTSEGLEFDDFDMLMMEEDFIEPGNPPVDETEPQYDPEKDNYEDDPEDDDAIPDLMDDSDSVETVTSEGYFDGIDSFFDEDDLL